MKYKVHILDSAQSEILEAAQWYENQTIGLGKKFLKEFRGSIKAIGLTPSGFAYRFLSFRALTMSRFPCLIYYQVDDEKRHALIFAVLHSHRNPAFLQLRLPK